MARIFLSYDSRDRELARELERGLEEKGHQSVWRVDELIAGRGWGELMPQRMARADAVVSRLTPNSQETTSVWCEIGAARALANTDKRTALLPVIIDLDKKPVRAVSRAGLPAPHVAPLCSAESTSDRSMTAVPALARIRWLALFAHQIAS